MKKIIKKIGFIILLLVVYFLGAGEVIWYPNVTPRFITNIIVGIGIAWVLFEKDIRLIIYEIGTWIYKTNKTQKINDTTEVFNGFTRLLSICTLFIVFKGIFLITTLVGIIKKSGILETVKLCCLLIGLGILILIVCLIEYQDNKSKSKKVVSF
jgi:hypothetical protein